MNTRTPQGRSRTRARAPRNTLNRERVLAAAVDLLDHAGPDAFTMRALAQRLGVATMAVYSHFSGKEEIIDAVRERLLAEAELPAGPAAGGPADPREEIRQLCRAVYRLLADHPSVLRLLANRQVHGDEGTDFAERALSVLLRAGLEPAAAARAYTALMQFTVGAALWAARGRERDREREACAGAREAAGAPADAEDRSHAGAHSPEGDGAPGERPRFRLAALPAERYPCLVDLAPELESAARDGMEQYERGLAALLTGLLGPAQAAPGG